MVATKLTEKIHDPRNPKEHYQPFLRKKNTKPLKQSKITTQQPKTIECPKCINIKSVTIEHPKISHKSSKTIRQIKKASQVVGADTNSDSPLYSEPAKREKFLDKKKLK